MTVTCDREEVPTEPPTDLLTIRAWVDCGCEDGRPVIRARLMYAPALRAEPIRRVVANTDDLFLGVREWIERLEQAGVTYCDTIE